jgi:hypothetical protein
MFFARMTNNNVAAKPQKDGWLAADVSYRVNPVHNRSNTQSLQPIAARGPICEPHYRLPSRNTR